MRTSWPRRVSSATPDGVIATLNSLFLVSVGMPTRMPLIVKKLQTRCKDPEDTLVEFDYARRKYRISAQCRAASEGSSARRPGRRGPQNLEPAACRCPHHQQCTGRGTRH